MDKSLINDIIDRLRECADTLSECVKEGDEEDLEYEVDNAQHMLAAASRSLREML